MASIARLPRCAGGDPRHAHDRRCLSRLVEALPSPPAGWKWRTGSVESGWSVWLESPRGGAFHVVELIPAPTIGALATVIDAYIAGVEGGWTTPIA